MDLKDLYKEIGGNYDEIISRMRTEERVLKFVKMFLKDENYSKLEDAMNEDDIETAFRAVHTLKGVAANLAFTSLFEVSSEMTEYLRDGSDPESAKGCLGKVGQVYNSIQELIAAM